MKYLRVLGAALYVVVAGLPLLHGLYVRSQIDALDEQVSRMELIAAHPGPEVARSAPPANGLGVVETTDSSRQAVVAPVEKAERADVAHDTGPSIADVDAQGVE